jgi:uncharacterized protein YdeI (YjbR/CyaY-like superfamily)
MPDPRLEVEPGTRAAWRRWLARNHATSTGVMLIYKKKNAPGPGLRYEDALDEALCFGWIDSKVGAYDETRRIQLFTPRRPKSAWSKRNKDHIERLSAEGRMTDAGRAAIRRAQENGSWTLLDGPEALEVPDDLARALDRNPVARTNFDAFPRSSRRSFLFWVASAKRAETRARRIAEVVRLAAANIKSPV